MKKLTPKQEAFAQAIASGATQAQAYRTEYNCPNLSPLNLRSESSKTAALEHVAARIKELKGETARSKGVSREFKRSVLAEMIRDKSAPRRDRLLAIQIDNRMTGDEKVKVEGELTLGEIFREMAPTLALPQANEFIDVEVVTKPEKRKQDATPAEPRRKSGAP